MENDGVMYMTRLNVDTGEDEIFISKEEWANGYRFIRCYDEDSYFYWDRNASEIGIKNMDGTIEKVLLRGPEEERFTVYPSSDGMLYRRTMDYGAMQPDITLWISRHGRLSILPKKWINII